MALVERQQVSDSVSLSEDDDGRVCNSDLELAIFLDHGGRYLDVICPKRVHGVRPPSDLPEKGELGFDTHARYQQIVELG